MPRNPKALPFALLALALVAPAFAVEAGAAAPRLVIPEPVAELGQVDRGQTVPHEFVLRNEGDAPLQILDVRPGCGCTVAEFDRVIAPGEEGKIRARLDTTGIHHATVKSIMVMTNDPATPRTQLTLRVTAVEHITLDPGYTRFVRGRGHGPEVAHNLVFSDNYRALAIEQVESPYPFLEIEVRPATEEERKAGVEGNQYVVIATLDYDEAEVGPLSGDVKLHTNHPHHPLAKLPVSGFVRPLVAITPAAADFGEVVISEPTTARFLVQNFGAEPLKVTGVDLALPATESRFEAIEEGRRYAVELVLSPQAPKGPFRTEMKIHTDSAAMPVIVVPISGTVL